MEKTVKYELTKEEKDLLMKCANEVAKNCNCDYCQGAVLSILNKRDVS